MSMRRRAQSCLPTIVLASRSARRKDLLEMCRIPHVAVASGVKEVRGIGARPSDIVAENAYRKARTVASRRADGIVIGADTIVYIDGKVVGKIKTRDGVRRCLRRLTKKVSYVYTGLAVIDVSTGRCARGYARTRIMMKRICEKDMDRWLSHLRPYDRAGGFSIEGPGSILFPHIEGCYFNIVGLPMSKLYDLFGQLGHNLLDYMEEA